MITVSTPDGKTTVHFPDGTDAKTIDAAMREATKPKLDTKGKVGGVNPLTSKILQGASLGLSDEITSGIAALVRAPFTDKTIGEEYNTMQEGEKKAREYMDTEHPVLSTALEVGGGLATGGALPSLTKRVMAGPLAKRVGAAIVDGAGYGAISGAGNAEDGHRLEGAGKGALVGAVAAPVIQHVAAPLVRGAGRLVGIKPKTVPRIMSPNHLRNIDDAKEFNVNLSRAQATERPSDFSVEQGARGGGYGPGPENTAKAFDEKQFSEISDAALALVNKHSGPNNLGDVGHMGENALHSARSAATTLQNASRASYQKAEQLGAQVDGQAILGLPAQIRGKLSSMFSIPPWETKVPDKYSHTLDAIDTIDKYAAQVQAHMADPAHRSISASLTGIDDIRKSFIQGMTNATNPADRMALGHVINEFDQWTDNAIGKHLVNGSPEALQHLREAQDIWKQYKTFANIGKNSGERSVAHAIDINKDVQPREFIQQILGPGKTTPGGGGAVRAAEQYKRLVGTNSEGWKAVKSAALQRSLEGLNIGPGAKPNYGKVSKDLKEFIEGSGRSLANSLFKPNEIAELSRFSRVMATMHGSPTNPAALNRVMSMIRRFSPMVGITIGTMLGNVPGAVAGGGLAVGLTHLAGKAAAKRFNLPIARVPVTPRALSAPVVGNFSGDLVNRSQR